jgi:hypothetical protein
MAPADSESENNLNKFEYERYSDDFMKLLFTVVAIIMTL